MVVYDWDRKVWICVVMAARKDNPAVKKGMPYIWVKKDNFAKKEYFKNEEELNKKYPISTFRQIHKKELKLLKEYREVLKEKDISPYMFLKGRQ